MADDHNIHNTTRSFPHPSALRLFFSERALQPRNVFGDNHSAIRLSLSMGWRTIHRFAPLNLIVLLDPHTCFIAPERDAYICVESSFVRNDSVQRALARIATERKYESRLLFLLAKTYLMVQNRPAAAGCLRNCLRRNVYSSEALQLAIDSRLLKLEEVYKIVDETSPSIATNTSAIRILKSLLEIYNINVGG